LCFRDAGAVNRLWKKYTGTKVYWILQYTIPIYWCSVAVSNTYCSSPAVSKPIYCSFRTVFPYCSSLKYHTAATKTIMQNLQYIEIPGIL
jgi:hypothetical protein